jgi:hypothetical protein
MKHVFINKFKALLFLAFCISLFAAISSAQTREETEPISISAITAAKFPANAQKVLPASIPAEINQALEKLIEAGEGKIVAGDAEVVAWAGANYKKASAAGLIKQVETALTAKGWIYEVGGVEGDMTVFSALKENPTKRAVLGYFIATDEALVLAWTEALPAEGANAQTEEPPMPVKNSSNATSGNMQQLAGKWEKKQSGMSSYQNGVYQGSSGNYESYTFYADGRVDYSSLIAVQNYGCRMEVFSSQKGRAKLTGGSLNINLTNGNLTRDDSCSKSKNYTKPMDATSFNYSWKIEKDEYGTVQLALTQADGQTFYYVRAK